MFVGSKTVFRMGVPPNRIEIITSIAGVEFADCYSRRIKMSIGDVEVPVICYEDLKRNKSSTGRGQDIADIEKLEKRRRGAT